MVSSNTEVINEQKNYLINSIIRCNKLLLFRIENLWYENKCELA